jgi:GNAT superfamily N-acetyltransferase
MPPRDAVEIRPATTADAEAISRVAIRALRGTNARDYTPDVIERLAASFTPERFSARIAGRPVYVALAHGAVVGTANLDGTAARAVFVDPVLQGRGIGAALMAAVEDLARTRSVMTLHVQSSTTAEGFYRKLGYVAVGEKFHDNERTIMMEKRLIT